MIDVTLPGQIAAEWNLLKAQRDLLPESFRPRTATDTSRQKYSAAMGVAPTQQAEDEEAPELYSAAAQASVFEYFQRFFGLLAKIITLSQQAPEWLNTLPIQAHDITYHLAQYQLLKKLFPQARDYSEWDKGIKNYQQETKPILTSSPATEEQPKKRVRFTESDKKAKEEVKDDSMGLKNTICLRMLQEHFGPTEHSLDEILALLSPEQFIDFLVTKISTLEDEAQSWMLIQYLLDRLPAEKKLLLLEYIPGLTEILKKIPEEDIADRKTALKTIQLLFAIKKYLIKKMLQQQNNPTDNPIIAALNDMKHKAAISLLREKSDGFETKIFLQHIVSIEAILATLPQPPNITKQTLHILRVIVDNTHNELRENASQKEKYLACRSTLFNSFVHALSPEQKINLRQFCRKLIADNKPEDVYVENVQVLLAHSFYEETFAYYLDQPKNPEALRAFARQFQYYAMVRTTASAITELDRLVTQIKKGHDLTAQEVSNFLQAQIASQRTRQILSAQQIQDLSAAYFASKDTAGFNIETFINTQADELNIPRNVLTRIFQDWQEKIRSAKIAEATQPNFKKFLEKNNRTLLLHNMDRNSVNITMMQRLRHYFIAASQEGQAEIKFNLVCSAIDARLQALPEDNAVRHFFKTEVGRVLRKKSTGSYDALMSIYDALHAFHHNDYTQACSAFSGQPTLQKNYIAFLKKYGFEQTLLEKLTDPACAKEQWVQEMSNLLLAEAEKTGFWRGIVTFSKQMLVNWRHGKTPLNLYVAPSAIQKFVRKLLRKPPIETPAPNEIKALQFLGRLLKQKNDTVRVCRMLNNHLVRRDFINHPETLIDLFIHYKIKGIDTTPLEKAMMTWHVLPVTGSIAKSLKSCLAENPLLKKQLATVASDFVTKLTGEQAEAFNLAAAPRAFNFTITGENFSEKQLDLFVMLTHQPQYYQTEKLNEFFNQLNTLQLNQEQWTSIFALLFKNNPLDPEQEKLFFTNAFIWIDNHDAESIISKAFRRFLIDNDKEKEKYCRYLMLDNPLSTAEERKMFLAATTCRPLVTKFTAETKKSKTDVVLNAARQAKRKVFIDALLAIKNYNEDDKKCALFLLTEEPDFRQDIVALGEVKPFYDFFVTENPLATDTDQALFVTMLCQFDEARRRFLEALLYKGFDPEKLLRMHRVVVAALEKEEAKKSPPVEDINPKSSIELSKLKNIHALKDLSLSIEAQLTRAQEAVLEPAIPQSRQIVLISGSSANDVNRGDQAAMSTVIADTGNQQDVLFVLPSTQTGSNLSLPDNLEGNNFSAMMVKWAQALLEGKTLVLPVKAEEAPSRGSFWQAHPQMTEKSLDLPFGKRGIKIDSPSASQNFVPMCLLAPDITAAAIQFQQLFLSAIALYYHLMAGHWAEELGYRQDKLVEAFIPYQRDICQLAQGKAILDIFFEAAAVDPTHLKYSIAPESTTDDDYDVYAQEARERAAAAPILVQ